MTEYYLGAKHKCEWEYWIIKNLKQISHVFEKQLFLSHSLHIKYKLCLKTKNAIFVTTMANYFDFRCFEADIIFHIYWKKKN